MQQGAASLLNKYTTLVCVHVGEILSVASSLAVYGPRYFVVSSQIIQRELTGVLLPEFLNAMVLLQTCIPSVMDSSRTVPLMSGLLDKLDKFNRLAPGVQKEDEEDLAWPGGIGTELFAPNLVLRVSSSSRHTKREEEETLGTMLVCAMFLPSLASRSCRLGPLFRAGISSISFHFEPQSHGWPESRSPGPSMKRLNLTLSPLTVPKLQTGVN